MPVTALKYTVTKVKYMVRMMNMDIEKLKTTLDDIKTRQMVLRAIEDKARKNTCKPELTVDDIITVCFDTVKGLL